MFQEILLERSGIYLERAVVAGVFFKHLEDFGCDVLGFFPVFVVPFLKYRDRGACDLDVEFNILREPRNCKIG